MNNAMIQLIGRSDDLKITIDIPEPCSMQELLNHFETFMRAMGYDIPANEQLDIIQKEWVGAIKEADEDGWSTPLEDLVEDRWRTWGKI